MEFFASIPVNKVFVRAGHWSHYLLYCKNASIVVDNKDGNSPIQIFRFHDWPARTVMEFLDYIPVNKVFVRAGPGPEIFGLCNPLTYTI